jgi:universal stress protein E
MRPIKKILVAIKQPGSAKTAAIRKAAQLATALNAELELFHALSTPLYIGYTSPDDRNWRAVQKEDHARAEAALEKTAAALRRHGIRVKVRADWDYPVYEAVVRRAMHYGADLVVAERHEGKHAAPWLLRYTDWELLRLCPVPFLLVKKSQPYRRPVVLAAVDPLHTFAKPAKLDREILAVAETVQQALRGSVHAVNAYLALPVYPNSELPTNQSILERSEELARKQAQAAFDRELKASSVPARNQHVVQGHPADVIPKLARTTRASIAVLGAISRSGLKKLVIGNTAEAIFDALPCDILIVKPAHFKTRVSRRARGPAFVMPPETQWI